MSKADENDLPDITPWDIRVDQLMRARRSDHTPEPWLAEFAGITSPVCQTLIPNIGT